jgi:cyclohexanecarboxyl-CoA dehydrogenase
VLPLAVGAGSRGEAHALRRDAKDAIETAMVTFGNLGYSTEMPLQQRYRDVASYLIADGTAGIQKRVIATAMMGKVAAL